ncbi:MAG TPA: MFS transporter [Streptosporangiaceae bacterium]|nr:MFS transporter [Streptosporangiaceae bacterium]
MQGHERTTTAAERDPSPHPAPGPQRRPWSLLILLSVAEFMVILDVTVVNVALPSIGRALHFAAGDLQWVVTAYVLLSGGLVLLGGRASDLVGRRRVFLAGLAVFTAASLASGLAPSAGALIAARAGQGLGAALLTPAALSIITTAYSGAQRAAALSTWAALGSGGAAAGVLAGGVLTTWLGWRSVFLVNVPVGVVAGLLSLRLVPRSAAAARIGPELDLPGALLATAGLVTGVYAVVGAPLHGWWSGRTLLLLAASLGLLTAFAAVERSARRPLLPPRTWRTRSLVAGAAVMLGATGILVGTFFLNSLYLQEVAGASALRTGLEFLPLVVVIGLGAHLTSRLLPRVGSRVLAVAGLVLMGGGAVLLSLVPAHAGYLTGLLPGLLVIAAGTGLVFPAASVTAMSDIADDRAGLASGLMTTGHEIGAALGVAVFSAVATTQAAAGGGFAAGYRHGFAVAAGIAAALALVAALAIPAVRPAPGARVAVH